MTLFKYLRLVRRYSSMANFKKESINWEYYTNPSNFADIANNIVSRKVSCDLKNILLQLQELNKQKNNPENSETLKEQLVPMLFWLPNMTHPRVLENKSEEPVKIGKVGEKTTFSYFPTPFYYLARQLNTLRTRHLGHMAGAKSYYFKDELATFEQSLVRFGISKLTKKGFQLISVPDILSKDCIENCGMRTEQTHSQVYHIENDWAPNLCLSGTAEMALASHFSGKSYNLADLPLRLCSVSRCYRAEAKRHHKEKGIFRVHQFTKVEMFGITANETGNESEELLEEFTSTQKEIFSELGLCFKIFEMPPTDLGLPAYHKIDMEAWIPTQKIYGEISSASNCTDYQCRRMDIKYTSPSGETKFCHTVNGTACAIPRLLIAIFENNQNRNGSINVPKPLQQYMKKEVLSDKFKEIVLSTKPIG